MTADIPSTPTPTSTASGLRVAVECFDLVHHDDDTCDWTVNVQMLGLGAFALGRLKTAFHDHPQVESIDFLHELLDRDEAMRLLIAAFEVTRDEFLRTNDGVEEFMGLHFDAEPWLRLHLDDEKAAALLATAEAELA